MISQLGIPNEWLESGPYSWPQSLKEKRMVDRLDQITRFHYYNCREYRNVVDNVFGGLKEDRYARLDEVPFFPVSLFKRQDLLSVPTERVFKVLTSSGTTGTAVSRIFLDQHTSRMQSKVLVKIMQHFLGRKRLPMVIVDHPNVVKNRQSFSARGAGIMGLMQFGRKPVYALRSDMSLDMDTVQKYLDEHQGKRILFFGFTFMVWKHFVRNLEAEGVRLPAHDGILIHSGGGKNWNRRKSVWKNLTLELPRAAEFGKSSIFTEWLSKWVVCFLRIRCIACMHLYSRMY